MSDPTKDTMSDKPRTITLVAAWRKEITIEIPDGMDLPEPLEHLDGWPEEMLEQIDMSGAELHDWHVRTP